MSRVTDLSDARRVEAIEDQPLHAFDRHPLLGHRVAIAHGDRAVLERIDVDGDAPRRADLVLAPVELADGGRVVVDGHRVALQVGLDPVAQLDDLGPLLEQRQDGHLVRREVGVERQRHARLAADLLLAVGVDQEGERRPVGAGGGLDDPRDEVLVGRRVEVLEVLAAGLRMARQVEVAPVVDALELLPAEREAVLDVDRLLGVVGQLVGGVLAQAEPRRRHAVALVPGAPLGQPLLERVGRLGLGPDEVLHLHLLELAHPEDEVARADLVAERLADLGDPERQLLARRLLDVLEVDVRALGRLRPQVDDRGVLLDRAHERLEHQVEAARCRERAAVDRAPQAEPLDDRRVAQLGGGEVLGAGQLVEPEALVVRRALDQRVAEAPDVAGRDPDLGVHQDPGVEADDVVALLDHRPPPGALDVVLELDAERPVVPDGVDAAVDLGRREDEAAPLRERDDRLELGDGGRDVVRIAGRGVGHEDLRAVGLGRPMLPQPSRQRVGVITIGTG